VNVVPDAAVNDTAVPTSAIAYGTPVIGRTVVPCATGTFTVVEVPAAVKVNKAVVSVVVAPMSNCQTRIDCPADEATRFAELPVPVTATDRVGR
jgi:hypothetical protein